MNNHQEENWKENSQFVLRELERLGESAERIQGMLHDLHIDLSLLKGKAAVWGGVAGAIGSAIIAYLSTKLSK